MRPPPVCTGCNTRTTKTDNCVYIDYTQTINDHCYQRFGAQQQGRKMRSQTAKPTFILVCLITISLFILRKHYNSQKTDDIFIEWTSCMTSMTRSLRGNYKKTWSRIGQVAHECEKPHERVLRIMDFRNGDEVKRHILPIEETFEEKSVIITLGVGHDIAAEESLLKKMRPNTVEFYGADPMVEINEAMYSKIGHFFPFAVGAKAGFSKASVLDKNYHDKLVLYVDAVYFLKNLVGKTFIDDIWVDVEGGEYELFPLFYKGGIFDQHGITFCQVNMEIHVPRDEEMRKAVHDFFFQIIDNQKYAIFRLVYNSHIRLFLFNFEDQRCQEKYLEIN